MIRMTEPMPCPRCRRLVVPGEVTFYDVDDDGANYTIGDVHACTPTETS